MTEVVPKRKWTDRKNGKTYFHHVYEYFLGL